MSQFNFCFYIDDCPVYSDSYDIRSFTPLFLESDGRRYNRPHSEIFRKNSLIYGIEDDERNPDEYESEAFEFCCSVGEAIERLELTGYTLKRARQVFNDTVTEYRNGLKDSILSKQIIAKAQIPKFYTFNNWQAEVRRVISQKKRFSRWDKNREEFDKLFPCLAVNDRITSDYIVYSHEHILNILRAILEVADKNSKLILDYTEQMHEGFYREDEFIMVGKPKSIILTEGSTDSLILKETLRALFPYFHEYFHFMDFDSSKSTGGAGALVNNLKAFIGSGITNHIIAIFDNDTAARDALRGLENIVLPSNIRIMQLPMLKLARKYPTLGPQGNRLTNINGLACSIELYFGVDVLADSTGTLIPVQWTGYIKNLRQYQGEITDKNRLQERYLSKVRDTIDNPNHRKNYDWTGMNQVFQSIFTAFKRLARSY